MIIMKQIICILANNLRKRLKKQPRHVRGICPHRLTLVFVRHLDDPLLEQAIVPFVIYSCIVNIWSFAFETVFMNTKAQGQLFSLATKAESVLSLNPLKFI